MRAHTTISGAHRVEEPDDSVRVEESDGKVNFYRGPRNQRRRYRCETPDGLVHFYRGPPPARRYRVERKDNGTVEHFVPSATHRVNGKRLYAVWPNGRVDVFGGPDDHRSGVYSIHPDGCRDHYKGDAGKEVRTRRDLPKPGAVQIMARDGDQEYVKEERWPRLGLRRVYNGRSRKVYLEFAQPRSEPEWVVGSRAAKLDALQGEYARAWAPHDKLDAAQGTLATALAPSEHEESGPTGGREKTHTKGRTSRALPPYSAFVLTSVRINAHG